ncbi:MAG: N-acetyltransferase [Xanthobacteraceae bacterium]|nr:N-acetyltransferase [Xanthobacteraceae bacterium]QYK46337.1 MAG: N-acetyltransferase [Xanthobacteraceae bacterium]HMN51369.1 GNAT family N-acetyltransferase [Xanthobacteraceae bacterium]
MSLIRDNKALSRYEFDVEGGTAFANYRLSPGVVTVTYTEVPVALRGRGIGAKLSTAVLEHIRVQGMKVIPRCGYFAGFIRDHPEYHDLLAQ